MTSTDSTSSLDLIDLASASPKKLGKRVLEMTLLWVGFGLLVGVGTAPSPTVIGYISGMIAGVIVLPVVGIMLGLLGGRWQETLVGGLGGWWVGLAIALITGSGLLIQTSTNLVAGGLVGGTFPAFMRHFQRLLKSALALRGQAN